MFYPRALKSVVTGLRVIAYIKWDKGNLSKFSCQNHLSVVALPCRVARGADAGQVGVCTLTVRCLLWQLPLVVNLAIELALLYEKEMNVCRGFYCLW